jgi:hypothetical protein
MNLAACMPFYHCVGTILVYIALRHWLETWYSHSSIGLLVLADNACTTLLENSLLVIVP